MKSKSNTNQSCKTPNKCMLYDIYLHPICRHHNAIRRLWLPRPPFYASISRLRCSRHWHNTETTKFIVQDCHVFRSPPWFPVFAVTVPRRSTFIEPLRFPDFKLVWNFFPVADIFVFVCARLAKRPKTAPLDRKSAFSPLPIRTHGHNHPVSKHETNQKFASAVPI